MEGQDGLIGRLLGTCLLERLIGTGGMGKVYSARQIRPVREVAVKVLQSGMMVRTSEHQAFLARFRREANVIAQLDHINIMPIYEYGEQDEYAYLVMPYLTGGSLLERLREQNALEPEEALIYIEQIASALHYAHQRKIVHRDVKPGNILFHSDGRLVLADFGIARIVQNAEEEDTALTSEQQIVGSVEYMAPEMVSGKVIDHRADIYELGVVLFQMLTGRLPFQGRAALEIAIKHLEEPFPSVVQVNPRLSPAIGAVVAKATAKSPDERYQSTLAMAQALREAVAQAKNPGQSRSAYATNPGWTAQETHLFPQSQVGASIQIAATDYTSHPARGNGERQSEPFKQTMGSVPGREMPASQLYTTQAEAEQRIYQTGIPDLVGRSPAKKSAKWPVWVVACLLLLGLGAGAYLRYPQFITGTFTNPNGTSPTATSVPVGGGGTVVPPTPTDTQQPSPTADPSQQAVNLLQQYYLYINQKDYLHAYNLLGTKLRKLQTYDQYVSGFASTQQDVLAIKNNTKQDDGNYNLSVSLQATQKDNSSTMYTGYYIIGIEGSSGELKIIDSHLQ